MPSELLYMLEHWGIQLDDVTFQRVFDEFDRHKKGRISFLDFRATVGEVMLPQEGPYFRLDQGPQRGRELLCSVKGCQRTPLGSHGLCVLHMRERKQKAMAALIEIYRRIGSENWENFLSHLKKNS